MYEIRGFVGADFAENAYLVRRRDSASVVAIDPGRQAAEVADAVAGAGLTLEAILLTHAHLDHIEGIATLRERHPAPIRLHPADRSMYDAIEQQAAMFGLRAERQPPPDAELADGETFEAAGVRFEVRHTPGHSPGHVILYMPDASAALVGDVIFQGSIGRTDLPGGDYRTLIASIRARVLTLPDDTVLHPGHGPRTTVLHERKTNPFLVPQYGGSLA